MTPGRSIVNVAVRSKPPIRKKTSRLHSAERVDRGADARNYGDLHVFVTLVSALLRKGAAMNVGLRADLHIHTREAEPFIAYNARHAIARAA